MAKTGKTGLLVVTQLDTLAIEKDSSATYTKSDPHLASKPSILRFSLNGEEYSRIKGLLLETGFMDIPKTEYPQSQNATKFVSYNLVAKTADKVKSVSWVEQAAYEGTIPPLVLNIGTQLDGLIASKT